MGGDDTFNGREQQGEQIKENKGKVFCCSHLVFTPQKTRASFPHIISTLCFKHLRSHCRNQEEPVAPLVNERPLMLLMWECYTCCLGVSVSVSPFINDLFSCWPGEADRGAGGSRHYRTSTCRTTKVGSSEDTHVVAISTTTTVGRLHANIWTNWCNCVCHVTKKTNTGFLLCSRQYRHA